MASLLFLMIVSVPLQPSVSFAGRSPGFCSSFFFVAEIECPNKRQLRGERLYFSLKFQREESIVAWQWEQGTG